MTLEKVIENIKKIEVTEDFVNDVICAYEDYEYKGETEVIVSKDSDTEYQAYINHQDAPIIRISIDEERVKDAWVA